eukprot:GILK01006813.1.p1 GENE.GILK01006813.1~~GILK01006813.1.p1  ORF type:complete len:194 (-),score=6.01 GILK01006813.1:167-709(-)
METTLLLRPHSATWREQLADFITAVYSAPYIGLFETAIILAVAIVLTKTWGTSCDKPLHYWALVYAVGAAFLLFPRQCIDKGLLSGRTRHVALFSYDFVLFSFFLGWLTMGSFWFFKSETCRTNVPELYQLCLVLLIVGYLVTSIIGLVACCMGCASFLSETIRTYRNEAHHPSERERLC